MTEKFIAISPKGKEFAFSRAIMIAVPTSSAQRIADDLTRNKYQIKEGQIWAVHDNDWYYDSDIYGEIKRYNPRRLKLYRYCG